MPSDNSGERVDEYCDSTELDFSPSSTAVDPAAAAQDQSETIQTGRHSYTENATFIRDDIPAKSDRWETLNQANRDFYADETDNEDEGDHIEKERRKQDHVNDTVCWGRYVGLTDHEIERAASFVLDAEDAYKRNYSIEAIILAALSLAANEGQGERGTHPRTIRPEVPLMTSTDNETVTDGLRDLRDNFGQLRDDLTVSRDAIHDSRTHLRQTVIYEND